MHAQRVKKGLVLASFIAAAFAVGISAQESRSASLSNVSVTLSNPRLSTSAELAAGNTEGGSEVVVDGASGAPSESTHQLMDGDTVTIGTGSYTVTDIVNDTIFTVNQGLLTGDADAGDPIYANQNSDLTVRFTTTNAVPNGKIRVLVPAAASDNADSVPDSDGFDFTTGTPTVTCPGDEATYDFDVGTATANVTIGSNTYHSFVCPYTGTGTVSTDFDGASVAGGTDGDPIVISSVINPAPSVEVGNEHTTGTADSYRIVVQNLNASDDVIDTTTVAVGVIEAVRVTATVAPQISFTIAGITNGATACNVTTSVPTTANAVPFGELAIPTFRNAAQSLSVSTNAVNGYTVTAVANDQLARNGVACAGDNGTGLDADCIPDAEVVSMDEVISQDWSDETYKGFGYSIENVDAAAVAFEYDGSGATFRAKHFADLAAGESPQSLFSSTTVADSETINVCYRAIISAIQGAGNYENNVTYTATATF